jgi:hypothetical protein
VILVLKRPSGGRGIEGLLVRLEVSYSLGSWSVTGVARLRGMLEDVEGCWRTLEDVVKRPG